MKLALAAATALSLLAAPAFAQEASSTVNLTGTVGKACGAGGHGSGSTPSTASATQDIALGALTDGDGRLVEQSHHADLGNLWCNTPSTMTVAVTPLTTTSTTTDTSSFFNLINLEVTAEAAYMGANNVITTSGAPAQKTSGALPAIETGQTNYDDLEIKILVPSEDRPLAGDYTGKVVVTLTAS